MVQLGKDRWGQLAFGQVAADMEGALLALAKGDAAQGSSAARECEEPACLHSNSKAPLTRRGRSRTYRARQQVWPLIQCGHCEHAADVVVVVVVVVQLE